MMNPPAQLCCEYLENPLGIGTPQPRLSWRLDDERRGIRQSAYQVLVSTSPDNLAREHGDLWDSGRVSSEQTNQVVYTGAPLVSRQRCVWKVRAWDATGQISPWSEPGWWEMGLLAPADWSAEWIGLADERLPRPPVFLRRVIYLPPAPVRRARIYATALGVYELHLNGQRLGDERLSPGWTDYRRRVLYQTYEVTSLLQPGENVLGAVLADGWFIGPLFTSRNNFGEPPPRLLLQLEVESGVDETQRFISDGSWQAAHGPLLSAELYAGETCDARLEQTGWAALGFNASAWQPVQVYPDPGAIRAAQSIPPIRFTSELQPGAIQETSPGVFVFDFGQNLAGACRLKARGPAGTEIRLRHAEVLNPDGSLDVANLRTAQAMDVYILKGDPQGETYLPRFTYHGFRYVELSGYPDQPDPETLTALALHSAARQSGRMVTSSALVNRIWKAVTWSLRDNLPGLLTDCPQRDERLGWLGDAQIIAETACFSLDMAALLAKIVQDIEDAQQPDGAYPDIAPYSSLGGTLPPNGAPGWADAGAIIPWAAYRFYGDVRLLANHFDSLARYVDYLARHNPDGLWTKKRGNDYGDWVPAGRESDKTAFATLYYFYSARLVALAAGALGREMEAAHYRRLARKIARAFHQFYWEGQGYANQSQTILALALAFGIPLNRSHREQVERNLAQAVEQNGCRLTTGFHGTRWLLPALCEAGRTDLAYRLLLSREYPSWGYMLEKGATTIWERWNSDVERPDMNSRNHFAFGAVGDFLFRYVAGIDQPPGSTGFRQVLIRPRLPPSGSELDWVQAEYESLHGVIRSEWRRDGEQLLFKVTIPPNARGTVCLPAAGLRQVRESGKSLRSAEGVLSARASAGQMVVRVEPGSYEFTVRP